MLLIDDEADNASVNIAYDKDGSPGSMVRSETSSRLFARSSYVGYTATPFANIFIDPETDDEMLGADVFPRDFIVSLDPPSNYFGPNRIFQDDPSRISSDRSTTPKTLLPLSHKIDFEVAALPSEPDRTR